MRSSLGARACGLALLVVGCAHVPTVQVPRNRTFDLEAYAKQIDPGEVQPLVDVLGGESLETLKGHAADHEAQAGALVAAKTHRAAVSRSVAWSLEKVVLGEPDGHRPFFELLAGIFEAERVAKEGAPEKSKEALILLAEMYWEANRAGAVVESAAALRSAGGVVVSANVDPQKELMAQFGRLKEQTDLLARHTAAQVLRDPPSEETLVAVLRHLAELENERRHLDQELLLREELARHPALARSADHAALALGYFRNLDIPEGEAALARWPDRGESPSDQALVRRAERARGLASTVLALRDSTEFENRLTLAGADLKLGLTEAAQQEYERLRQSHPNDARVHTGWVMTHLVSGWRERGLESLIRLYQELDRPDLDHRDEEYLRLTEGLAGVTLLGRAFRASQQSGDNPIAPALAALREMQTLSGDLAHFDAPRGTAMVYLAHLIEDALPLVAEGGFEHSFDRLSRCFTESRAGLTKYPTSVQWEQIATTCACFERDTEAALAAMEAPLPKKIPNRSGRLEQRIHVEFGLIAERGAPAHLEALERMAKELRALNPEREAEMSALDGDIASIRARLKNDERSRDQAEAFYRRAIAAGLIDSEKARVLSNLAFWRWLEGNRADAVNLWREAATADSNHSEFPRFMLLLVKHDAGDTEAAAQIDKLEMPAFSDLEQQWLAWRLELARQRKDSAAVQTLATTLLARRRGHTELRGSGGMLIHKTLQAAVQWWIDAEDVEIQFPLLLFASPDLLLGIPAPLTWSDIATLAGKK